MANTFMLVIPKDIKLGLNNAYPSTLRPAVNSCSLPIYTARTCIAARAASSLLWYWQVRWTTAQRRRLDQAERACGQSELVVTLNWRRLSCCPSRTRHRSPAGGRARPVRRWLLASYITYIGRACVYVASEQRDYERHTSIERTLASEELDKLHTTLPRLCVFNACHVRHSYI